MSTYSYFDLQSENLQSSEEFKINDQGDLFFHKINLKSIIEEHGTPLKITFLPIISKQIKKAKKNVSKCKRGAQL
jgi:arginine decarboxylase